MTINSERNNYTLSLAVIGRLDTTTAPQLEAVISEQTEGISALVIDMIKLEYISSAGLRVLLAAHKKMAKAGGSFKLLNVNDDIMEVLDMTGFSDMLTIEN